MAQEEVSSWSSLCLRRKVSRSVGNEIPGPGGFASGRTKHLGAEVISILQTLPERRSV
jgi:hypothetical protein